MDLPTRKEKKQTADATGSRSLGRPFLQPLTVAGVCLILVSLLLIMGLMNLKALGETLVGYMENRGRTIIKEVHQVAERDFQQLSQTHQAFFDAQTGSPLTEEAFSLQESFIIDLTELAGDFDRNLEASRLSNEQLQSLLAKESLQLIAVLDQEGNIILESRPIPQEILRLARPVIEGYEDFKINLFKIILQ